MKHFFIKYVIFLTLLFSSQSAFAAKPHALVQGTLVYQPCAVSNQEDIVSCLALPVELKNTSIIITRARSGNSWSKIIKTNGQGRFSLRIRSGSYNFQIYRKNGNYQGQPAITSSNAYRFKAGHQYNLALTATPFPS